MSTANISGVVEDIDTLAVISAVRILLGVMAVVGNLFILRLYFHFDRLRGNAYNCLVGLLCLSNLMVGLGMLVRGIFTATASAQGVTSYNKSTCYAVNGLIGIGKTAGEVVILGIAIERFRAVHRPLATPSDGRDLLVPATFVAAVLVCVCLTYGKQVGIDNSKPILVCTAGVATGPYTFLITSIYTGILLTTLYAIYSTSLIKFKMKTSAVAFNIRKTFKKQSKIFYSVSLIVFSYTVFYGIPFSFSILTVIFTFSSSIKSAITIFAGLSAGLNATLDCFIYLFKHDDINHFTLKIVSQWFPPIQPVKPITVSSVVPLPAIRI